MLKVCYPSTIGLNQKQVIEANLGIKYLYEIIVISKCNHSRKDKIAIQTLKRNQL